MLLGMPKVYDSNVLVGYDTSDDAGAYVLDNGTILVQTLDFFTPICDDPYTYGRIAAANALSDIYAMGAKPLTAMNIVCYPCSMGKDIIRDILRGGADKIIEAEAVLLGGHSIEDEEPKYGLSVTGIIESEGTVITNSKAKPEDYLILTKPLGTGIIATAIKGESASEEVMQNAYEVMAALNDKASKAMVESNIESATDVTGFGLLGHLYEMMKASKVSATLWMESIPVLPGAYDLINEGFVPAGAGRNQHYLKDFVNIDAQVDVNKSNILFDPQTSGGLLICAPEDKLTKLVDKLNEYEVFHKIIGRVHELNDKFVYVVNDRSDFVQK